MRPTPRLSTWNTIPPGVTRFVRGMPGSYQRSILASIMDLSPLPGPVPEVVGEEPGDGAGRGGFVGDHHGGGPLTPGPSPARGIGIYTTLPRLARSGK